MEETPLRTDQPLHQRHSHGDAMDELRPVRREGQPGAQAGPVILFQSAASAFADSNFRILRSNSTTESPNFARRIGLSMAASSSDCFEISTSPMSTSLECA